MENIKKIGLDYECPTCWWRKHVIYKSYLIAKRNRVYCDMCITKEMRCITINSDELISTLD